MTGCAIGLLAVPGPSAALLPSNPNGLDHGAGRWAFVALVVLAAAVVAADIWHVLPRLARAGLTDALIQHRTDRATQTGAYALPGAEVAHALAALTGVLGYALWAGRRDRFGAVATVLGLASMLTSTGRWDVVGYVLWCFIVETTIGRQRAPRRVILGTARVFALLAVFFVVHGQLMRKVDQLNELARMSTERRIATVNVPVNLGLVEAASPAREASAAADDQTTEAPRPSRELEDGVTARHTGATPPPPAAETHADAEVAGPAPDAGVCVRWVEGAREANLRFQELPSLLRVGVLYFAGPLAAFDRIVCEGRPAARPVLFYWPRKIGRLAGLVPASSTLAVDPFVDIGLPFNNFTVVYSFCSELGRLGGLLAWLATALALRRFSSWAVTRGAGIPVVVAGLAPVAVEVRTPWTNSFFDGTLAVWIGTALALTAISRHAARTDQR
ncbi:MAG: hypothetical protein QN178_14785 [Armatimonadota bacterium]|nr:hypothetical protein [Armatimonadota bacterium]